MLRAHHLILIWGVEKAQYGFVDFDIWSRNDGKGLVLKGKIRKEKKWLQVQKRERIMKA